MTMGIVLESEKPDIQEKEGIGLSVGVIYRWLPQAGIWGDVD